MERNVRLLPVLFSIILLVIPLGMFPNRLRLPLAGGSPANLLYEFVFYGVVLFLFRRNTNLMALVVGSALTLIYRLALGAGFGLTIALLYNMNSSIALSLGMLKYLPAVLLHVAAAPFIVRPFYLNLADSLVGRQDREMPSEELSFSPDASMPAVAPSQPALQRQEEFVPTSQPEAPQTPAWTPPPDINPAAVVGFHAEAKPSPKYATSEINQFDKAIQYLSESGSVKLAMIVDEEGLPLSCFNRSTFDPEVWGPLSVELSIQNRRMLRHFRYIDTPDRIDIGTHNVRIILRRIEHVNLLVLAEQTTDETIHIRIAQAADMIRKYMSERYSPALFARVEEQYVSDS